MFFVNEKNQTLQFPEDLNLRLKKSLFGSSEPDFNEIKKIKSQLEKLWKILAVDRGIQSEDHYSFDNKLVKTYASYYLPVNILKPAVILEELSLLGLKLQLHKTIRWLDLGTGPGTLFLGLKWWLEQHGYNHDLSILGLDQSKNFINLAQEMDGQIDFDLKSNRNFKTIKNKKDILKEIELFKPNVLSAMNSLAEIEPNLQKRIEFIKEVLAVFEKVSPNGLILFIEPGSKKNSRELIELREWIKQKYNIWLPCLSDRDCGAFQDQKDWCHEAVDCEFPDWINELGKNAQMQKDSLLFSYLVFTCGTFFEPEKFPHKSFRMVSDRMQEKGLTKCYFCTHDGVKRMARLIHSRENDQNADFLNIKRGDIITESVIDEKNNVQQIERVKLTSEIF